MLELFTAACGLVQSVLVLKKRKENWVFYLLNIGALTLYSAHVRLWGDVVENLAYVLFGILGFCTWYKVRVARRFCRDDRIRYCTGGERALGLALAASISAGMYLWLLATDDPMPWLDALTTGLGFTATLGMALKRVESWILWLVDDVLMACVYFLLPGTGFWLMLLNIVWVFLAVGSFLTWHEEAAGRPLPMMGMLKRKAE